MRRITSHSSLNINDDEQAWFARYLPPSLILGDPGSRDAAIHAIQACIPHAQLLPIGVELLIILSKSVKYIF